MEENGAKGGFGETGSFMAGYGTRRAGVAKILSGPFKRVQQMPWHVRSTDATPAARRRPLVRPALARPSPIAWEFAFSARVRGRESDTVPPGPLHRSGHFVAPRVYSQPKEHPLSLSL